MANDIASLGLRVDSSEVDRGTESLQKLAQAGAQSENAAKKLGDSWSKSTSDGLGQASATWKQFISARLSDYTKLEGSHAAAMRRLGQEWRDLKGTFSVPPPANPLKPIDDALIKTGISAKQTAAALRGVPAQFTDIAVSLQGGQNPLTVLLQQGGQLKDMFGGIGPASRALGGYVAGLINPFSLAAAAAGTLGLAYYKGSQESERFNKALILTGGYAGVTSGQLADLARELDGIAGVTQRSAAAALTQVAESGKFTGEQIKLVATAAAQMRVATGKSVEDTVAEFAKLRKDPVGAILELNDQYHFLTQSQLDQIRSLKEQGREQDAASAAFKIYAGVIAERTPQIAENLGTIEDAWKLLKEAAAETIDGALSIGRVAPDAQIIDDLTKRIAYLKSTVGSGFEPFADTPAEIAKLQSQLDKLTASQKTAAAAVKQTIDSGEAKDRLKAEADWDRIKLGNLGKQARLEYDIAEIRKVGLKAGKDQAEIDKQVEAERLKYEESLSKPRTKAYQDDAATRMLQSLGQQEAALRAQLDTTQKLTGAQKDLAEFERLIADLKTKGTLTADQKSLLANEAKERAQLKVNVSLEEELEKRRQLNSLVERAAQLQESMSNSLRNQQEQYDRQLSGAGLGSQARERIESERSIYREFQRYQEQLDKATPKDQLGSEEYKRASQSIQNSLNTALKANQNYYQALDQQNQDWAVGASDAFNDYLDSARNVAGQTRDMFSNAFSNMEDGIVDFVKTGKLSFKDFADSLIEDLIRIQVRQAAAGLLSSAFSGGSSLFGGSGTITGFSEGHSYSLAANAKGGVYESPSLSAYSGKVYDSPQFFAFAKGAGVFGEAGPEAIMPLTRAADGSLGVRATGGASSTGDSASITQTFHINGDVSPQTVAMIQQATKQATIDAYQSIGKDFKQNGPLRQMLRR